MAGLVWNQLYSLKKVIKLYLAAIAIYLVIGQLNGSVTAFGGIFLLLASMLVINSFSVIEKSNWDLFVNTMPVSKGQIVGVHYLLGLLAVCAVFVLNNIVIAVDAHLKAYSPREDFLMNYGIFTAAVFFLLVMIPVLVKCGTEKARIVLFCVYVIPFLIGYGLSKTEISMPTKSQLDTLAKLSPLLMLLLLFVSYAISLHFYKKKDF